MGNCILHLSCDKRTWIWLARTVQCTETMALGICSLSAIEGAGSRDYFRACDIILHTQGAEQLKLVASSQGSFTVLYSVVTGSMEVGGDEFSDWILKLGVHIQDKRLKAVFSEVCLGTTRKGTTSQPAVLVYHIYYVSTSHPLNTHTHTHTHVFFFF